MFRDKPTAYDRLSDALSDIGERLAEIEERAVETVRPRPTRTERLRRSFDRANPFHSEPTGLAIVTKTSRVTPPSPDPAAAAPKT